ncbi:MAG: hypothetical protein DMG67_04365 [Acidobacteria bacterium]|nr:MAG: hypothetical protein DMG67_04365 [Acidobacteriota bacterium]
MTMSAIIEGTNLVARPPLTQLEPYLGCYWTLVHAPGSCIQTIPDASCYLVVEIPDEGPRQCLLAGPRLKTDLPDREPPRAAGQISGASR